MSHLSYMFAFSCSLFIVETLFDLSAKVCTTALVDACEDDLASPHDYPMDILNLVAVRDFNFSVGDFLW